MIPLEKVKRIIFGWIVDYLCWDGLNDFLSTLNSESILRTQDLINACLTTSVLMDDVPYRQQQTKLLSFLMKICNGNNPDLNNKCKITILEAAVIQLDELKSMIPELEENVKELEVQLKINALIVCCSAGNFSLASAVYKRLDINRLKYSGLLTEKDKELLRDLQHVMLHKDKNHELLRSYSYKSFVRSWVPLFQHIHESTRAPHLVEMCQGMIGNKLIAIATNPKEMETVRSMNDEDSSCAEINDAKYESRHDAYIAKFEKALQLLNYDSNFSSKLKMQKPQSLSKLSDGDKRQLNRKGVLGTIESIVADSKNEVGINSIIESNCNPSIALQNTSSTAKAPYNFDRNFSLNECRVLCTPLEKDRNVADSLRNLLFNECRVLCTRLEEDKNIPESLRNLCKNHIEEISARPSLDENHEKLQDNQTALRQDFPDHTDSRDFDYFGVEEAAANLFEGNLSGEKWIEKGNISQEEIEFLRSATESVEERSVTILESTPLSKMPKLDFTMGTIYSRRTTLTPRPRSPVKVPKQKKKIAWTFDEECKLYSGVRLYNEGNWERIRWQFDLRHKTGNNLSDKWRNLKKNSAKMKLLKEHYTNKLELERNQSGDSPVF